MPNQVRLHLFLPVLKNAFLTAEGAVTLIEENTHYSLYRANILIIGYGRIGKALHNILKGYGAYVTVCSRSKESEADSVFNGAKHISFNDLKSANDADIIINTVPLKPIFVITHTVKHKLIAYSVKHMAFCRHRK